MKILVISHGPLAQGLIETSQMIIGQSETVHFMSLNSSDSVDVFYENIEKFVSEVSDDILILADLLGGSPMLSAARVISANPTRRTGLVTGVNLPMLLEVISQIDMGNDEFDTILKLAETTGREGIKVLSNKGGES